MRSQSSTNLCAVLLCVRTKTGAKLVFNTAEVDHNNEASTVPVDRHGDAQDTAIAEDTALEKQGQVHGPPELTFGLKTTVLQERLCPGRWSDGQKFEMTIDGLNFVGQPCFAQYDEHWHEERPTIQSSKSVNGTSIGINIDEPELPSRTVHDFTHAADSFDSGLQPPSLGTSTDSASTRSAPISEALQMFHIVFVTKQLQAEHASLRLSDVYNELCLPLTRAIRHLQEQSRFVEVQCRKISLARAKSRAAITTHETIQHESELSAALVELHHAISKNTIARFHLQGMEMSLQIFPEHNVLPLSMSSLHAALLLLEDRAQLILSLDGRPGTAALSYFLTHLTPTKPLSKLASKLGLPSEAVLFLAEHLVKWRKARMINPLHVRNSYVVSPTAPLDALPDLALEYAKKFPALQSLDQMLSMIGSNHASPYVSFIPSKVHKDTYMDILTWLVRHEIATRLHTVGWLVLQIKDRDESHAGKEDGVDDNSSTISDSGTAFRPDEQHHPSRTQKQRVLAPTAMTPSERRAVLALRHSLGSDGEVQDTFTRLIKYLDGESPLENVAILEGMKRSKVEACLGRLHDIGCIQTYQYV